MDAGGHRQLTPGFETVVRRALWFQLGVNIAFTAPFLLLLGISVYVAFVRPSSIVPIAGSAGLLGLSGSLIAAIPAARALAKFATGVRFAEAVTRAYRAAALALLVLVLGGAITVGTGVVLGRMGFGLVFASILMMAFLGTLNCWYVLRSARSAVR